MNVATISIVALAALCVSGCGAVSSSLISDANARPSPSTLSRLGCQQPGVSNTSAQVSTWNQVIIQVEPGGSATVHAPDKSTANTVANVFLVQLGAFDTVEDAQMAFRRLRQQLRDLVGARRQQIEETEKDGRTYYRLRLAPATASRAIAEELCTSFKQRGRACVVVNPLE